VLQAIYRESTVVTKTASAGKCSAASVGNGTDTPVKIVGKPEKRRVGNLRFITLYPTASPFLMLFPTSRAFVVVATRRQKLRSRNFGAVKP